MTINHTFNRNFFARKNHLNLSWSDLSKILNVKSTTIRTWVNNNNPSLSTLEKICFALKTKPELLLSEDFDPTE